MNTVYNEYFQKIKEYVIDIGLKGSIIGCEPSDISVVEKEIGKALPEAYKAWLLSFGKEMPYSLFDRQMATIDSLRKATSAIAYDRQYDLLNYQSYLFIDYVDYRDMYTILNIGSDDPEVLYFFADDWITSQSNKFTSWIRDKVIAYLKLNAKIESSQWVAKKKWLSIDSFEISNSFRKNDDFNVYDKHKKLFTAIIEQEDIKQGKFTLPDEFQEKWVAYLKVNNLSYFLSRINK